MCLDTLVAVRAPASAPPEPGMWDVHVPPGNVAYFRSVWNRRDYMMYSASNELRSRQMTSLLGNLWHLLNPMLQIGVYFLVFGVVLDVNRGENYFTFLSIGIFVFGFTQRSTMSGASSIANNKGLLNAFSFPRALLPVTSTLTEAMATISPIVVVYAVAIATGVPPSWRWLALLPLLGVQLLFNFGAALLSARVTSSVSDVTQLLPFVFRILLYVSGVLFDVSLYAEGKGYEWLFELNPIYGIVTLARWAILGGELRVDLFVTFLAWTVAVAVVGLAWFRAGEGTYGRE
jgi:teichoic acid transport system permease protein